MNNWGTKISVEPDVKSERDPQARDTDEPHEVSSEKHRESNEEESSDEEDEEEAGSRRQRVLRASPPRSPSPERSVPTPQLETHQISDADNNNTREMENNLEEKDQVTSENGKSGIRESSEDSSDSEEETSFRSNRQAQSPPRSPSPVKSISEDGEVSDRDEERYQKRKASSVSTQITFTSEISFWG